MGNKRIYASFVCETASGPLAAWLDGLCRETAAVGFSNEAKRFSFELLVGWQRLERLQPGLYRGQARLLREVREVVARDAATLLAAATQGPPDFSELAEMVSSEKFEGDPDTLFMGVDEALLFLTAAEELAAGNEDEVLSDEEFDSLLEAGMKLEVAVIDRPHQFFKCWEARAIQQTAAPSPLQPPSQFWESRVSLIWDIFPVDGVMAAVKTDLALRRR